MCSTLILPFGDICCWVNYTPPGALINTHTNMCMHQDTQIHYVQNLRAQVEEMKLGGPTWEKNKANEVFAESEVTLDLLGVKPSPTPLMNKLALRCLETLGPQRPGCPAQSSNTPPAHHILHKHLLPPVCRPWTI